MPAPGAPGPDRSSTGLTSAHGEPPPEPQPAPRHRASLRPDPPAPRDAAAKSCLLRRRRYGQPSRVPAVACTAGERLAADVGRSARELDRGACPVKRLAAAKSRLRGARARRTARGAGAGPGLRHGRARRWPARRWPGRGGDRRPGGGGGAGGARRRACVPDAPDAGLNAAFAARRRPRSPAGRRCAALAADLPALRPAELADALRGAEDGRDARRAAFVPDAAGTGHGAAHRRRRAAAGPALRAGLGGRARGQRAPCRSTATGRACAATWTPPRTCAAAARASGVGPRTAALTVGGCRLGGLTRCGAACRARWRRSTPATRHRRRCCSTTAPRCASPPRRSTPPGCGCCAWASGCASTPTPDGEVVRVDTCRR